MKLNNEYHVSVHIKHVLFVLLPRLQVEADGNSPVLWDSSDWTVGSSFIDK